MAPQPDQRVTTRLGRALTHPTYLSVSLGLLIVVLSASSLFPQLTPETAGDAYHLAVWLGRVELRYGPTTVTLADIGLFRIGRSPLLWLPLALLIIGLLAWVLRRLAPTWRLARGSRRAPIESLVRAPLIARVGEPLRTHALISRLTPLLRRESLRVDSLDGSDGTLLRLDRHRWANWGTILCHLAPVLLLVGALLTAMYGRLEPLELSSDGARPDLRLVSIGMAADDGAPSALLQTARGDILHIDPYHPVRIEGRRLHWGESWQIEGMHYLALTVHHDPGWPLFLAAAIALCLGLFLRLYWEPSTFWLRVGSDGTLRLVLDDACRQARHQVALERLSTELRAALAPATANRGER